MRDTPNALIDSDNQHISSKRFILQSATDLFLNVSEESLETRSYLLKSTIPSVVNALEGLLEELNTRDIDLVTNKPRNNQSQSPDIPHVPFDSLNWLAQHLFRNNPKYSQKARRDYDIAAAAIADQLEDRILQIKAEKEAKRLAEEEAARLEQERLRKERLAKLTEKRAQFTELLNLSYKLWIQSLWRKEPGQIYIFEIIREFKRVADMPEILAQTELFQKILNLIEIISNKESTLPKANENNIIFDEDDPLYEQDIAAVDRWENDVYVKIMLRLLIDWNTNELTEFLRNLSANLSTNSDNLNSNFKEVFFLPKFNHVAVVRDWLQQLLPLIQIMDLSNPLTKESAKRACQGFCLGREDPRFAFAEVGTMEDEVFENANPAVAFAETSYCRFLKCLLGEFGIECYTELMTHIKTEHSKDQQHPVEEVRSVSVVQKQVSQKQENAIDNEFEGIEKISALLKSIFSNGLTFDGAKLKAMISESIHEYEKKPEEQRLLQELSKLVTPSEQLNANSLATLVYKASRQVLNDAIMLAECIVAINSPKAEKRAETPSESKKDYRAVYEKAALNHLQKLRENIELKYQKCAEASLQILENLFQNLYPGLEIIGRIGLMEKGVLKLTEGKALLTETDSLKANSIVETYLRIIGCTENVKLELFGKAITKEMAVDFDMLESKLETFIPMASIQSKFQQDLFYSANIIQRMKASSFIGAPLISKNGEAYGAIDFLIENQEFDKLDLVFLETAKKIISETFEIIKTRKYIYDLGVSARDFIKARVEKEIDLHVRFDGHAIYRVENVVASTDAEQDGNSSYFPSVEAQISAVANDKLDSIKSVFDSMKTTSLNGHTYVPIMDPESNICFGILSFEGDDEDIKSAIESLAQVLGSSIQKSSKSFIQTVESDIELDAELIDENARTKLRFGKWVLLKAREEINGLDSKTIAELRSYRKPPLSVHRIMRGALYLFGHKPKALKQWAETVKHITSDFLHALSNFDPTGVHKKVYFKRARKIAKLVTWKDSCQKGSKPAQVICDWLIVTLALRDIAIKAKKSRPDLYERVQTASTVDEEEDEGTDTEILEPSESIDALGDKKNVEDVDVAMTDEAGNLVKNIELSDK